MKSSLVRETIRVASALSFAAVGAAGPAWSQADLTDQNTSPPSRLLSDDLSLPVLEPKPVGGWAYGESPSASNQSRSIPAYADGEKGNGPAPEFASPRSVRELMTAPFLAEPGDGRVWARTRDMRASFGPEGFTAYPIFGSRSSQEWPVHFDVASATLGGDPLSVSMDGAPFRVDTQVTIPRDDLREVYHVGLDSIEQTFVFDTLPGTGDLTVLLSVATELTCVASEAELRFEHDTFGGITYGSAFVLDADGMRLEVQRRWTGESIVLTVPAAFLANATLPITIDPPIAAWTNGFGADDDSHSDITYAGNPGRYFICWQDFTSATNADVFMVSILANGTAQGNPIVVEITNDYWATPRVAYSPAGPRLLVVASRSADGPGTGVGAIKGQMVNPVTNALVGGAFNVSTTGSYKIDPDIGGTNYESTTNNHFLVAWTRILSTTTHSIEYRVIDWSGPAVTAVIVVDSAPAVMNRKLAVSESHGDATLSGDWWTMAWIRDFNNDGQGQLWARRVVWSGNTMLGTGNFRVGTEFTCTSVSVTSRLDESILATGDRPSIIAYERQLLVGGDTNIYARVVTDGQYYSVNSFSSNMEDFDPGLSQIQPSIGTDGDCFLLSYAEDWWGSGTGVDYDMYMLSGHVTTSGSDAFLALAERHENMAATGFDDMDGRLAMIQDGNNQTTSDDGFCVWTRVLTGERGELRGRSLDCRTTDISPLHSVGEQYCSANAHAASSMGGRLNSWLWILGTQSVGDTHVAAVIDMPAFTYGYLICSEATAFVNMPGNSQGRLCLGGSIGRFATQVGNSGASLGFGTVFDPQMLPQPTGTATALPGETWYFQVWHRDSLSGQPTSNFSNACRLHFLP